MAFVLHIPIVISCLLEQVVTYFNKAYSLRKHEAVFSHQQERYSYKEQGSQVKKKINKNIQEQTE